MKTRFQPDYICWYHSSAVKRVLCLQDWPYGIFKICTYLCGSHLRICLSPSSVGMTATAPNKLFMTICANVEELWQLIARQQVLRVVNIWGIVTLPSHSYTQTGSYLSAMNFKKIGQNKQTLAMVETVFDIVPAANLQPRLQRQDCIFVPQLWALGTLEMGVF